MGVKGQVGTCRLGDKGGARGQGLQRRARARARALGAYRRFILARARDTTG